MANPSLRQIVTYSDCKKCMACCKYDHMYNGFAPIITKDQRDFFVENHSIASSQAKKKDDGNYVIKLLPNPAEGGLKCSCLGENMACSLQARKPFDCVLYPYILMNGRRKGEIFLCVDETCPRIESLLSTRKKKEYEAYLKRLFLKPSMIEFIARNPFAIERYQKHLKKLFRIKSIP